MSYLSFVMTKDYCITTSDGLLLFYGPNGEVQNSFNEFHKFKSISKRQMMGISFLGDAHHYDNLIKLVDEKLGKPKNNNFENGKIVDLKRLAYTIKMYLDDNSDDLCCHVVLIGFNKFNLPEMYVIHTNENIISSFSIVQDGVYYYPMVSDKSKINFEDLLSIWSTNQGNNIDMEFTLTNLENLSLLMSKNDPTVNDKFYSGVVFRKKKFKEILKEITNLLKDKFKLTEQK